MSITFTPEAGTWNAVTYYEERDEPSGFYRAINEMPSVNCHNSGGYVLQVAFGLEPDDCGCIEASQIAQTLETFRNYLGSSLNTGAITYLEAKRDDIEQMLFHCLHHKCGLTFG